MELQKLENITKDVLREFNGITYSINTSKKSDSLYLYLYLQGTQISMRIANHQYKNKYCTDIVNKSWCPFAHCTFNHAIKHLHNQFNYILEPIRNFLRLLDFTIGNYGKHYHQRHNNQDAGMWCGNPHLLPEHMQREDTMNHKVNIIGIWRQ